MKDSNLLKCFILLTIYSIILILIVFFGSPLENTTIFDEDVVSFNEGWYYKEDASKKVNLVLPVKLDLPKYTTLKISNKLPNYKMEGMTLGLFTSMQSLHVYIDNDMVYEYGFDQESVFNRTNANSFHLIHIPNDAKNREITLEFTSSYPAKTGELNPIILGSKSSIIYYIFQNRLVSFILCILIFMSGFVFLFLYIYTRMKFKESRSLLYLGLFSIIVSIWSMTGTKMLQFIFPYQYIEYMITYLSLMLCPIPFLLFIKGATHSNKSIGYNILCTLFIANVIISNSMELLGILNYYDLLPITIILIIGTLIMVIFTLIKEIFYYKNKESYTLGISLSILSIFIIIDLIRFFTNDYSFTDASRLTRIGLFVFIIMIGLTTCKKLLRMMEMGINAKAIQKLAYQDILTGIKNRTAYTKEIDELNKSLTTRSTITTVMFDLNNVKHANDNYGHDVGDLIIISAASCIKNSIMDHGECYRIGGDEFAAVLMTTDNKILSKCVARLQDEIDRYNQSNRIPLEIPYGYSHYNSFLDRDLYATFNRADRLMYELKAKMKT